MARKLPTLQREAAERQAEQAKRRQRGPVAGTASDAANIGETKRLLWLDRARLVAAQLQDLAESTPHGFARYGGKLKAATVADALDVLDGMADDYLPAV